MAGFSIPWALLFGLAGNITSFLVYLAPLPTFYRVIKNRSTEGFQSVPYVVALFSAMLLIYYGFLKPGAYLLMTINTFGCFIETIFIVIYLYFAPRKARIYTAKLFLLLDVGFFSMILLFSILLSKGAARLKVVGWICMTFSVSVFAAPLSIIRLVIRTKSVEYMPFMLSFFLTLSAIAWFMYGVLTKDVYVAFPNILGFSFGCLQMGLYIWYKDAKKVVEDEKLPEHVVDVPKVSQSPEPTSAQVQMVDAGEKSIGQGEPRVCANCGCSKELVGNQGQQNMVAV